MIESENPNLQLTKPRTPNPNPQTHVELCKPPGETTRRLLVAMGTPDTPRFSSAFEVSHVNSLTGTQPASLTYDAPVISTILSGNAATSGHVSVTHLGMNFGAMDFTATSSVYYEDSVLGSCRSCNSCACSSWTSVSTLLCVTASVGASHKLRAVVTIAQVAGSGH